MDTGLDEDSDVLLRSGIEIDVPRLPDLIVSCVFSLPTLKSATYLTGTGMASYAIVRLD